MPKNNLADFFTETALDQINKNIEANQLRLNALLAELNPLRTAQAKLIATKKDMETFIANAAADAAPKPLTPKP